MTERQLQTTWIAAMAFWTMNLPLGAQPSKSAADAKTVLHGHVDLPLALESSEGKSIPKGKYRIEVRAKEERFDLAFFQKDRLVALTKSETRKPSKKSGKSDRPTVPLIGTVFLRDPVRKAPDRERESALAKRLKQRDWRAALRAYRHEDRDNRTVFFIFQQRLGGGKWVRRDFRLLSKRRPARSS